MKFSPPRRLEKNDDIDGFDCGEDSLNFWLRRIAKTAQRHNALNTYVVCERGTRRVVAYYAIKPGDVRPEAAPKNVKKGASKVQPIGIALIARLAVDRSCQNNKLGSGLLRHAILTIYGAIDVLGGRAIMVHALNDAATGFYKRHGFEEFPSGGKTLFLTVEDIRASLKAIEAEGSNQL